MRRQQPDLATHHVRNAHDRKRQLQVGTCPNCGHEVKSYKPKKQTCGMCKLRGQGQHMLVWGPAL